MVNIPDMPSAKRKRATHACDYCRSKKIRCNGEESGRSCPNCLDRGQVCRTSSLKLSRKRSAVPEVTNASSPLTPLSSSRGERALSAAPLLPDQLVRTAGHDSEPFSPDVDIRISGGSPEQVREASSIAPDDRTNWEYHGPRSYLSICSKPGIKWVCDKAGSHDFPQTAGDFASCVARHLTMNAEMSSQRMPDPDPDTAWRYVKAYFDVALDACLGILPRPHFESRLAAHLAAPAVDTSASWYALRNVVFAAGCRIELCNTTSSFKAGEYAWKYFENALAVYSQLLFFKTSIEGVQVLTLMAYYTQGIGTPCLEYMLVSDAVRLAYAKGLHRAPPSSQLIAKREVNRRNCVFWGLYCLEKQIASQADRPSIIVDDEITSLLPEDTTIGLNSRYCTSLIQLAQLSSRIEKHLSGIRALRTGVDNVVSIVQQLHEDVQNVRSVLESSSRIRLGGTIDGDHKNNELTLHHQLYLHYAFLSATLSVHTILAYPWVAELALPQFDDVAAHQIQRSAEIVAQTAREAILMTEHISLKAYTPVPVAFFGPIYAMITLFVCYVNGPRIPSDLTIMDIGTGYFGRLQLSTGSIVATPFARALTTVAYGLDTMKSNEPLTAVKHASNLDADAFAATDEIIWYPSHSATDFRLDFEDWSTLLPLMTGDDDNNVSFWAPVEDLTSMGLTFTGRPS